MPKSVATLIRRSRASTKSQHQPWVVCTAAGLYQSVKFFHQFRSILFHYSKSKFFIFGFSKGISSSALPYKRTPPSWLKISSQDVAFYLSMYQCSKIIFLYLVSCFLTFFFYCAICFSHLLNFLGGREYL